jgi:hypothetical protein
MAIARMRQIDASVARWYHCMTRCVRRAFLLGEGTSDRRAWIENRIEELAQIFAVAVGGFSVMTDHLDRTNSRRPIISRCLPVAGAMLGASFIGAT